MSGNKKAIYWAGAGAGPVFTVGAGGALKSTLGADWAVAVAWNSWAGFWPL